MKYFVNSTEEIKEHISINFAFDFDNLKPYVEQVHFADIEKAISRTQANSLLLSDESKYSEVKKHLGKATANFALLRYTSIGQVQITSSGFSVSESQHTKPAPWHMVLDLRRSFRDAAHEGIEQALCLMEAEPDVFDEWKASKAYTVFDELWVKTVVHFQEWFDISNHRQTFLALKPYMREVEQQFFTGFGDATKTILRTKNNPTVSNINRQLRAAEVAFTVAKVARYGTFQTTATGLFIRWDLLPGEKAQPVDQKQLDRLSKDKQEAGEQYLKKALELIYASDLFEEEKPSQSDTGFSVSDAKSIIFF